MEDQRQLTPEGERSLRLFRATQVLDVRTEEQLFGRILEYVNVLCYEYNCITRLATINRRFGMKAKEFGFTGKDAVHVLIMRGALIAVPRNRSLYLFNAEFYEEMKEAVTGDEFEKALERFVRNAV